MRERSGWGVPVVVWEWEKRTEKKKKKKKKRERESGLGKFPLQSRLRPAETVTQLIRPSAGRRTLEVWN